MPLGPREVVGLVNLRGKIVTAVSLRRRLGLEDPGPWNDALAIGMEYQGETFALFVDEVGDVITVSEDARIIAPPNFPAGRLELTVRRRTAWTAEYCRCSNSLRSFVSRLLKRGRHDWAHSRSNFDLPEVQIAASRVGFGVERKESLSK